MSADPNLSAAQSEQPNPPAQPAVQPSGGGRLPKRRRRRRWIIRLLIALPLLLIALLLLAPTLLSLGFVRSMVVPIVSSAVAPNGKLEIKSWKFAWTGGQRIEGITLYDNQQKAIAHLNVTTDASLLGLARGNYALGNTAVTGDFDARIDPATGKSNVEHVMGLDKPSPPDAKSPKKPSNAQPWDGKLPIDLAKVSGTLKLNLTGTISSTDPNDQTIPFTKIDTLALTADLNQLEQGVKLDGNVAMNVAGKPAAILLNGSADVIDRNALITDPNTIAANVVTDLRNIDLAIANGFLAKHDVTLAGTLGGKLLIDIQPGGSASVKSEALGIDNLVAAAPQLKGDTFRSRRLDLPVSITRAAGSDEIKIDALGLTSDIANVAITGTIPQAAINNLADSRAPGAAGQVVVETSVPAFAQVTAMFPNLIKLQQGVTVESGGLANRLVIDLKPDSATVTQALKLTAAGTSNGRPIQVQDVRLDSSADVALADGMKIDANDVLGFKVDFASSFANVSGGGVPTKASLGGSADLDKLRDEVAQFVDLSTVALQGKADFKLDTNGDPIDAAKPLGLVASFNVRGVTVGKDQTTYVNQENIKGNADLVIARPADKQVLTVNSLAVHSDSGLFDIETVGGPAWVATFTDGGFGGEGQFKVGAALDRLAAPFMALVDPQYRLERGRLLTTVVLSIDESTKAYKADVDGTIDRLAVGDALSEERVAFRANSKLGSDFSAAQAGYDLQSSFVTLKGDADVRLADSANPQRKLSPFEMVRSATFQGSVPDLQKLYVLANGLGLIPPETKTDADGKPLPPIQVDSGTLAFDGRVARDDAKRATSVILNVPGIEQLAISRGTRRFRQSDPITIAFAAELTTGSSKPAVGEQLQRMVLSKLEAKLPGLATLTMAEPIDIALGDKTPAVKGEIRGDADLAGVGGLLAVVSGADPIQNRGTLTFQQRLNSDNGQLAITGQAVASDLQSTAPNAQPLPETLRTLHVENDVAVDQAFTTLAISKLNVFAPQAKDVLSASVSGTVRDLMKQNTLDGMKAVIAYDLPQLWPLMQPLVDPTGETLGKNVEVAGKAIKTFPVAGSYPMTDADGKPLAFHQSVKSLVASGDLVVDKFAAPEKGIEVQSLAIPIALKDGVARIAYADGKLPADFDVNSGKGKLGGISVDLAAQEPIMGDLRDFQLLRGVTLNPLLSSFLGKFFNPLFPNATQARGLVDVTLSTSGLRLGPLITTERSGAATLVVSVTELEISNPLGEQLFGGFINNAAGAFNFGGIDTADFRNFAGEMKNATFRLNRGVLTQDATFMIGNVAETASSLARGEKPKQPTRYPFTFTGDVRLADLNMDLQAGLPLQFLKERVRGDAQQFLQFMPDQWPVSFTGSTTAPKVNFTGDVGRAFAQAALKYGASRLTGGDSNNATPGGASGGDPLGEILGGLGGGDRKDDRGSDSAPDREEGARTNDNASGQDRADDDSRGDDAKKKTQAQKRREAEAAAEAERKEQQAKEEARKRQDRQDASKKEADRKESSKRDDNRKGDDDDSTRDDTPRRSR